jgi:hypothetical protein
VHRSGIDQVLHGELPHVPQPLKDKMVNHAPLPLRKTNEAVHRTTHELARAIIISKVRNIGHADC